jgi:NTP pyrophosphatase (non-canonical NTP hydrolase)
MSDQLSDDTDRNGRIARYQGEVLGLSGVKFQDGREKYGDSWQHRDPEYLIRRMEEEFYEFRQAAEHDRSETAALEELADMVNFGLMFLIQQDTDQEIEDD